MKVRDVIKRSEQDGWKLARTKGSHRQFHHPIKPGTVTVAGHPSVDILPGNIEQYSQAGRPETKDVVIYEKSESGWGAYVPDLCGLGVAGRDLDEVKELIRGAIEFHLGGMRRHRDPIPEPTATTEYITV
ncbi:MAG TPA: type II toxin-antitoxin system HicA family toxin [Terriglobales bacterium]|nr:type II toxin-antitoxin system HicA family toxin [Terriglobales bacterium]